MVRRRDDEIDLAEASLLYAREEYPRLVLRNYLARLDELAAAVTRRLPEGAGPRRTLDALNDYLFQVEGFRGNEESYYDPRNSYLNEVLDRRLGIPITLSVVYLEVGRRLGLPLDGVGFPGHFLIRYAADGEAIFLDPYHGGAILNPDVFAESALQHSYYLAAVTKRQILTRMLTNLKAVYLKDEDFDRASRIVELLLLVNPGALEEIRDRGLIRFRLGQRLAALIDLETYLRFAAEAEDAATIRREAGAIWKRYARSN
jgi:regulator of sirC expression with transglutaminase-like and TPR domain